MSLITSCPACGTMFRVVPDQLKVSEGWVRCGHCGEVFDARAHVKNEIAPRVEPLPPPLEADTEPAGADWDDAQVPAVAQRQGRPPPDEALADEALRESPLDEPFVFRRSDLQGGDEPTEQPLQPPPQWRDAPLADHDQDVQDVSFLRQARRRALWKSPAVRAALVLAAVLLALALVLQVLLAERDRLAYTQPALRPLLVELCSLADCRIEPPRQIETLAIDNSAFNKLRSEIYRLSFTLKNNASMTVAVPWMELTLTDAQDQPVVRRVLSPKDLGAGARVLGAGADWSVSVAVAVNAGAQAGRISGYRLLAFYP